MRQVRNSPERRVSPSRSRGGSKPRDTRSRGGDPAPAEEGPTPICRCRVLYLGSSVPHITKDGLQGIQEPLKELYPEEGALGAKGIDSWLSVWSNGFLLENVDENRKKVSRFFPIDSLHYCAAVRYVQVPGTSGEKVQRFLPLDSPFARNPNINHPPLFAAILRRTTGIKVLECHVFICKRETAANALVRCSFHAYADSTYAKHLENGASLYGTVGSPTPLPPMMSGGPFPHNGDVGREFQQSMLEVSDDSLNSVDRYGDYGMIPNGGTVTNPLSTDNSPQGVSSNPAGGGGGVTNLSGNHHRQSNALPNGNSSPKENGVGGGVDDISVFNGDDNHKVWAGQEPEQLKVWTGQEQDTTDGVYGDYGSTMRSFRSSASGLSSRQRPRQMMMQSPPPPPIPEELVRESREEKKEKKKRKKSKTRELPEDGMSHLANGVVPNGNGMSTAGSVVNIPTGRASSMMGGRKMSAGSFMGISNGRPPMNGGPPPRGPPPHGHHGPPPSGPHGLPPPGPHGPHPGPHGPHPGPHGPHPGPHGPHPGQHGPPPGPHGPHPGPHGPPQGPMMMVPGHGHRSKKAGTFSARQKGMPRPIPPYMMYGPGMPPPPPGYMVPPGPPPHLMPPPGHPLYGQPPFGGHFPMSGGRGPESQVMEEPIYMPQHARPLSPVASYQPGHFPHDMYYSQQQYATIDRSGKQHNNNNNNNKKHKSNKAARHQSSDSNAEDSEYGGTGIYKKEHLNERAFANSMRNEHRSRSYGSLANMDFDPAGDHLQDPRAAGFDPKKDREILQMMEDVHLDEDRIERREVPADFYPPTRRGQVGPPGGPPPPAGGPMPPMVPGTNGPMPGRRRR